MVNYLRGVFNKDYDFSWRLLWRAGLEGILQGTLLTASGCAMALTHFNPVAAIVIAKLSAAAEVGVIPGALGAYDVLTGENQVRERTAAQVEEGLNDAPTEFACDVAGVQKVEDSDTIDLALESTSKTGAYYNDSYLRPPDYSDRNVVIPPDYADRPWR